MQTFHIDNMSCGGCVRGVTRAIQAVDAEATVTADTDTKRVTVASKQPQEVLLAALTQADWHAVAVAE